MLSKPETLKDTLQVLVESGATRVGHIATIITRAISEVAGEIGGFATDLFEMLEASRKAGKDGSESEKTPPD